MITKEKETTVTVARQRLVFLRIRLIKKSQTHKKTRWQQLTDTKHQSANQQTLCSPTVVFLFVVQIM